eukprot:403350215
MNSTTSQSKSYIKLFKPQSTDFFNIGIKESQTKGILEALSFIKKKTEKKLKGNIKIDQRVQGLLGNQESNHSNFQEPKANQPQQTQTQEMLIEANKLRRLMRNSNSQHGFNYSRHSFYQYKSESPQIIPIVKKIMPVSFDKKPLQSLTQIQQNKNENFFMTMDQTLNQTRKDFHRSQQLFQTQHLKENQTLIQAQQLSRAQINLALVQQSEQNTLSNLNQSRQTPDRHYLDFRYQINPSIINQNQYDMSKRDEAVSTLDYNPLTNRIDKNFENIEDLYNLKWEDKQIFKKTKVVGSTSNIYQKPPKARLQFTAIKQTNIMVDKLSPTRLPEDNLNMITNRLRENTQDKSQSQKQFPITQYHSPIKGVIKSQEFGKTLNQHNKSKSGIVPQYIQVSTGPLSKEEPNSNALNNHKILLKQFVNKNETEDFVQLSKTYYFQKNKRVQNEFLLNELITGNSKDTLYSHNDSTKSIQNPFQTKQLVPISQSNDKQTSTMNQNLTHSSHQSQDKNDSNSQKQDLKTKIGMNDYEILNEKQYTTQELDQILTRRMMQNSHKSSKNVLLYQQENFIDGKSQQVSNFNNFNNFSHNQDSYFDIMRINQQQKQNKTLVKNLRKGSDIKEITQKNIQKFASQSYSKFKPESQKDLHSNYFQKQQQQDKSNSGTQLLFLEKKSIIQIPTAVSNRSLNCSSLEADDLENLNNSDTEEKGNQKIDNISKSMKNQ